MNFLRRFKIGPRLALGFTLLLALMAAIVGVSLLQLQRMNAQFVEVIEVGGEKMDQANRLRNGINRIGLTMRDAVVAELDEDKRSSAIKLESARRNYEEAEGQLAKVFAAAGTQDEQRLFEAVKVAKAQAMEATQKVMAAIKGGAPLEEVRPLAEEAGAAQSRWALPVQELVELQRKSAADTAVASKANYRQTLIIVLGAAAAALVVGLGAAILLTISIVRPLTRALQVAETVAAGDLTIREQDPGRDEPARLLHALDRMTGELARVVTQVRSGSEHIASGTGQIAQGNEDLSQRTEEQASNLQQTAASMEQLNGTVRNTAETAREASELAASASAAAEQGGRAVQEVVQTMDGIRTSSQKVSDIIGVIDGIAFQTNILALNAAVEAARAGEQGRGFAVVAGEVRNLAQRSADAAKEIKGLISDSVAKVQSGSKLVDDTGRTMGDIVSQVKRVSEMISQISAAAMEQTQGIGQVSEAVTQLDQVTQQNAALVEQLAAAAGSLRTRSSELIGSIAVFRLEADALAVPPAAAVEAAPTRSAPAPSSPVKAPAEADAPAKPARAAGAPTAAAATSDDEWTHF